MPVIQNQPSFSTAARRDRYAATAICHTFCRGVYTATIQHGVAPCTMGCVRKALLHARFLFAFYMSDTGAA